MSVHEEENASAFQPPAGRSVRQASIGRVLVSFAVFAPALFIIGLFALSQGHIYSLHWHGPRWPWILADFGLLFLGISLMRGEDL